MNYKLLNKRQRKPKKQSRMDNPETLAKIRHKTGNEDKQNSNITQNEDVGSPPQFMVVSVLLIVY
jgi:hypothetical protein